MKRLEAIVAASAVQPRPYQSRIVTKLTDMLTGRYVNGMGQLEEESPSALIESPTGSGKTVMGLLGVRLLQEIYGPVPVGWMAMRRELLAQAARENVSKGIGVENLRLISMFDRNPPEDCEILVVDEAQHDASNSAAHIHNTIKPRKIIGLTATPFRADRVKLCFRKVIKDAGIHRLIQDGYLSKYHHYTIPTWKPSQVAEVYLMDLERWGKSIFYFHKRYECEEFIGCLRSAGVECEFVTGESDSEAQLARFNVPGNGLSFHRPIVNMMKLTEGFDCPDLKTAWVRDSGKGPTIQMGGRVFRMHPDHPVKQVVQSKDTLHPMLKTAMPEIQFIWENGQWLSLTVNPLISEITNVSRKVMARAQQDVPKYLSTKRKMRWQPPKADKSDDD